MRHAILFLIMLITGSFLKAQLPQLTSSDKASPIFLKVLETDVKILGSRSATTFTMTFYNPSQKVLEGTFVLPLPEGAMVTRYALDINGTMREGVPVEKNRATEVFESIEKRKIDPGLLERTEGNVFRTRIFPIPAGGERKIIIAFEQELYLNKKNELIYHLPFQSQKRLEKLTININVKHKGSNAVIDSTPVAGLKFLPFDNTCCAYVEKENAIVNGALSIRMQKDTSAIETYMQNGGGERYFYLHTFLPSAVREKTLPKKLAVIWDVSLSGLYRNIEKEVQLLEIYLKKCRNVSVDLYLLNNTFHAAGTFQVQSGDAKELIQKIKLQTYDGGTDYSKIILSKADETLLFSDGLSTLSDANFPVATHPVYTISSSAKADYSTLKNIAENHGGVFINLLHTNIPEAFESVTKQTLRYLGIKRNEDITEHYPFHPATVQNGFSLSGKMSGNETDITLLFGYGNKVLFEKKVTLQYKEFDAPEWSLSKLFAQKKIEELDKNYEKNKDEILRLGKQHLLVTRNTSLLVLEQVADYVAYGIEPPAELRSEYKRLLKEQRDAVTERKESTLENALDYAADLWKWWNKSYPVKNKAITKNTSSMSMADSAASGNADVSEIRLLRERSSSSQSSAMDVVSLEGISSNSLAGKAAGLNIQDVVVVAYGASTRTTIRGIQNSAANNSQLFIVDGNIASDLPPKEEIENIETLEPKAAIALYGSKGLNGVLLITTKNGINKKDPQININERISTADYLKALHAAAPKQQYQTYLKLRDKNLLNPNFYYDAARFFFKKDKALGLQILTNLGELDFQNHELHKLFGFGLKEADELAAQEYIFKKILLWRPQEPHSYRDYALALIEHGKHQAALDTLYLALTKEYNSNVMENYEGIEEIIVTEINHLVHAGSNLNIDAIHPKLLYKMPVDIRVVLNWNMNDTDIDLWVTDPDGEKAFYSNKTTSLGGRMSEDFTEGYGPEQFLLKKAKKGKYKIEVDYYGSNSVKIAGKTTLLVEVFTNYGRPHQQRKIIALQLEEGEEREGVFVGEFVF